MAPKGGSGKKESGRAKKAENEANKRAAAEEAKERAEASKWVEGENARLLAEEEASAQAKKAASAKAGAKKAANAKTKSAGPGAIAADDAPVAPAVSAEDSTKNGDEPQEVESFSATGIDNALDLLEVVTAKMDKASVGNQAASTIEKHPERRFKAAFNAYVDRELPNIRAEQPGLRLQQYKDLLFNNSRSHLRIRMPISFATRGVLVQIIDIRSDRFNQTTVEYNATTEDKVDALRQRQDEIRDRLREKS
ncbi:hypothetical protein BC826DRAFT_479432 [Russula brevipes]|nr:hypothetical protein BC826DRAFT_479432 [Russula brevipes]